MKKILLLLFSFSLLLADNIKYDALGSLKNNENPDAVVDYAT